MTAMVVEERRAPLVRLFAATPTIELAAGVPPTKGRERCVEAAAWLVEHPHCPPRQMSEALGIAEGTRRATLSHLRWWLDVTPDGQMYLPLAYRGTVALAPEVTSDWARLQRLVIGGVDVVPYDRLLDALDLVRGPFLGNQTANSFMWRWADMMARRVHDVVERIAVRAATNAHVNGDANRVDWIYARALHVVTEPELVRALDRAHAQRDSFRLDETPAGQPCWEQVGRRPTVVSPAVLTRVRRTLATPHS